MSWQVTTSEILKTSCLCLYVVSHQEGLKLTAVLVQVTASTIASQSAAALIYSIKRRNAY